VAAVDQADVRLSKFLSRVLRHDPAAIGISLDECGWTDVDVLLSRAAEAGRLFTRDDLLRVVRTNSKQRFRMSPDGTRIRASQGHSVAVDLGLEARAPPEHLYHGTAEHNLRAILRQGLTPQRRRHVHLSAEQATAIEVGRRHGRPVLLRVAAGAMHREGHVLLLSDNGVWLTRFIPPSHIEVVEQAP
jgi:putative RNA 2'-phosphotransferase